MQDAGVRWHQEQLDQRDLKAVRSAVDGAVTLYFGKINNLFRERWNPVVLLIA